MRKFGSYTYVVFGAVMAAGAASQASAADKYVVGVSNTLIGNVLYVHLPDDAIEVEFAAIWRRHGVHPLRTRFLETVAAAAGIRPMLT